MGTLLLSVFLIAGWDASLYVNEETENAEINPGRAVMISVVFLGLFYMLMMFAFQAVAPARPDRRSRRRRAQLRRRSGRGPPATRR